MRRVAALWLPNWSIDRIVRSEPMLAPPDAGSPADLAPLLASAAAERAVQCDAPRDSGWRPGARWARTASPRGNSRVEVEMQIAALPAHQRPPMRMLGRSSEAAKHLFRRLPGDDGGTPALRPSVPSVRYPGDGPHPDKPLRRGSNDPHSAPPGIAAFFDTGRTMAGLVAQACPDEASRARAGHAQGAAIVTVHKVGSRVEVLAASPAAAMLGIEPGMALTQVRASVPDVVVRDADPAGDAAALAQLATLLARRWSPVVAVSDSDGLFVDLSGVAHLHGGEERFARRLVRMLARFGIAARVAIADTAGAAWAIVRHHRGPLAICAPGDHGEAVSPLPVAALRLDPATVALLARLGVETVAEIRALPRAPLVRRFGAAAAIRLDQMLGTAPEPLDPIVPPERIAVSQRFAEPIATAEAIAHWLGRLVPRLADALAAAGLGARALILVADRVDHVAQGMRIGFARPTRDAAHMLRLMLRRIEEIAPGYGIDALHLHVRRADPLGAQPFDERLDTQAPDIAGLVDTIANRGVTLWRAAPVESDVPERSVRSVPPLDPPARGEAALKRDDVRRLDTRAPDHPWHPRWPRPARLLRRPEPIDNVLAALPDQPPVRFRWRGTLHTVVRADGPERIAGEWWKRGSERDAVRDYFQVEDESGARFWLFRRGDGERAETGDLGWFIHGVFG